MGAFNKIIACKEGFLPLFFESELDIYQWLREHYGAVFESGDKEGFILGNCVEDLLDSLCFHVTERAYARKRVKV